MPRSRSSRTRLTESTLSGLSQYLVTNCVPEVEAIAAIRAESTDVQLLSRVAGHQAASGIRDPRMAPRYDAAAALLVKVGGTDADAGRAERDAVLERSSHWPPSAPTLHQPGRFGEP
ncbi:hypothetical protein [Nocardioides jejuensis]|uniref:Uncharacterized protein n=1 Tax=Nocardioides jejuensis TaxID=2502782 RepID=A0A4R1BY67_9ACTN|nr:hypothetical protein [Nocardioides jejuensis]TCJ23010.1 hypothetical protein EPD65_11655 [Nocardioides jejuensis]